METKLWANEQSQFSPKVHEKKQSVNSVKQGKDIFRHGRDQLLQQVRWHTSCIELYKNCNNHNLAPKRCMVPTVPPMECCYIMKTMQSTYPVRHDGNNSRVVMTVGSGCQVSGMITLLIPHPCIHNFQMMQEKKATQPQGNVGS